MLHCCAVSEIGIVRKSLWATFIAGLRQNLVPGLILQAVALSLVLGYYFWPPARGVFSQIQSWKESGGFAFSAISTALFGGLIPFLFLAATGQAKNASWRAQCCFYVLFWAWKGVEVDALYRLQSFLFGDELNVKTIATKVAIDQFIYNPLWAAPSTAIPHLWKDTNFSWSATRETIRREGYVHMVASILVSTWIVWVPAVSIVYCLPPALQIPLFNIVLCFWVLMLSFLTRKREEPAPGSAGGTVNNVTVERASV